MKSIGAKQLRDELGGIVRRVQRGETIQVMYRSKPAFTISPIQSARRAYRPGSKEAMRSFVARARAANAIPGPVVFDPNKSMKELYHEMLDADPKYRPSYHR